MNKVIGLMTVLIIVAGYLPGFPQKPEDKRTVKIFGRVTDFKGQAVVGTTVELKDVHFKNVAATISGPDGHYSLDVPQGHYMALTAVKGYQVQSLEYWAWKNSVNFRSWTSLRS